MHKMNINLFRFRRYKPISWWFSPEHGILSKVSIPNCKHAWLPNVCFVYRWGFYTREEIINNHISHVWNFENRRKTHVFHHQQKFTINVCAIIVHNHLIRPYLLPNRLDGRNYLIFLHKVLLNILENVPLAVRQWLRFQHDVRQHLNKVFSNCWIGRGGQVLWPPHSPDLTPCFCGDDELFGVWDTKKLVACLAWAAAIFHETPYGFECVRQSLAHR